jgi:hypothetical protein
MKIRSGFVSNSSSSSFVILGFKLNNSQRTKLFELGHNKKFQCTETPDGIIVGTTEYFGEGFWDINEIDIKKAFEKPVLLAAAEFVGKSISDAKLYVGEFER